MASYTPTAEEAYENLVNTLSLADKPTQTSIATTGKIQGAAIEWQRGFTPIKVKNGTTPLQAETVINQVISAISAKSQGMTIPIKAILLGNTTIPKVVFDLLKVVLEERTDALLQMDTGTEITMKDVVELMPTGTTLPVLMNSLAALEIQKKTVHGLGNQPEGVAQFRAAVVAHVELCKSNLEDMLKFEQMLFEKGFDPNFDGKLMPNLRVRYGGWYHMMETLNGVVGQISRAAPLISTILDQDNPPVGMAILYRHQLRGAPSCLAEYQLDLGFTHFNFLGTLNSKMRENEPKSGNIIKTYDGLRNVFDTIFDSEVTVSSVIEHLLVEADALVRLLDENSKEREIVEMRAVLDGDITATGLMIAIIKKNVTPQTENPRYGSALNACIGSFMNDVLKQFGRGGAMEYVANDGYYSTIGRVNALNNMAEEFSATNQRNIPPLDHKDVLAIKLKSQRSYADATRTARTTTGRQTTRRREAAYNVQLEDTDGQSGNESEVSREYQQVLKVFLPGRCNYCEQRGHNKSGCIYLWVDHFRNELHYFSPLMLALFRHQGIEPGSPRLSGDHIDMTSQARNFEDHRLESPYTDEDIDKAIDDIDRRQAAIQATGNDPGQLFPPFGRNRFKPPRRGATRGGRGSASRQASSRRAAESGAGHLGGARYGGGGAPNPGEVPRRPEPESVPKRPERTLHAMQVELEQRDQQLADQQRELDELRASKKIQQAKDRKRQNKDSNKPDTERDWGSSEIDTDDTDYEEDVHL